MKISILLIFVSCMQLAESADDENAVPWANEEWLPEKMVGGMRKPRITFLTQADIYQTDALQLIKERRVLALDVAIQKQMPNAVLYDIVYEFSTHSHERRWKQNFEKSYAIMRIAAASRNTKVLKMFLDVSPKMIDALDYSYRFTLLQNDLAMREWLDSEVQARALKPSIGHFFLIPAGIGSIERSLFKNLLPLLLDDPIMKADYEIIRESLGQPAETKGAAYTTALKYCVRFQIKPLILQLMWQGTKLTEEIFCIAVVSDDNHILHIMLSFGGGLIHYSDNIADDNAGDDNITDDIVGENYAYKYLRLAIDHDRAENVGTLLEWFADAEHDQFPLLQLAIDCGKRAVVEAFLEHGNEIWQYAERALEYLKDRYAHVTDQNQLIIRQLLRQHLEEIP